MRRPHTDVLAYVLTSGIKGSRVGDALIVSPQGTTGTPIENRNAPGLEAFAETAYVRRQRSLRRGDCCSSGVANTDGRGMLVRRALTTVRSTSMVHAVHTHFTLTDAAAPSGARAGREIMPEQRIGHATQREINEGEIEDVRRHKAIPGHRGYRTRRG